MPKDEIPYHIKLAAFGRGMIARGELELLVDHGWPADVASEIKRLGRELLSASNAIKLIEEKQK